ncbi:hypothetical protein DM02DRAFT_106558 [Periconia macrospinosa]|uniref:Uncharacterized protein n=1 Tax=Periconia macrospinosa TaxID=97972 RepID=A0A2V1DEV9_9PLEO|nr:hypothetical protein DM02DRAFT_106558 [Periconia macrospinosa]
MYVYCLRIRFDSDRRRATHGNNISQLLTSWFIKVRRERGNMEGIGRAPERVGRALTTVYYCVGVLSIARITSPTLALHGHGCPEMALPDYTTHLSCLTPRQSTSPQKQSQYTKQPSHSYLIPFALLLSFNVQGSSPGSWSTRSQCTPPPTKAFS